MYAPDNNNIFSLYIILYTDSAWQSNCTQYMYSFHV